MSSPAAGKQTVLVADDTDDVRELMALQLRFAGYRVVEARDGFEAVALATSARPALILMDIHMPGMDGLTATRRLRQVEGLGGVVIVAISAFGSGDHRRRALAAECNAYFDKTKSIDRLADVARQFLPA